MKKRKYLIFILLGGMLVFISCMSAKPVEQSAQMSYEIDRWLCGILIDGYEILPEARQEAAAVNLDFWVRKTAHGIEYCALGILLFLAAGFLAKKQKKRCAAAFLTGAAFAALDEFHQYFVPGRSCELRDMLIDTTGVTAGILLAVAAGYLNRSKKRKNEPKSED